MGRTPPLVSVAIVRKLLVQVGRWLDRQRQAARRSRGLAAHLQLAEQGEETLTYLANTIKDRNYRLFAERGELHIINADVYARGRDPYELFEQLHAADARLDPSHAFYLGYELSKAVTALTLGKNYTQDQELRWGFLTVPEVSHRNPG